MEEGVELSNVNEGIGHPHAEGAGDGEDTNEAGLALRPEGGGEGADSAASSKDDGANEETHAEAKVDLVWSGVLSEKEECKSLSL